MNKKLLLLLLPVCLVFCLLLTCKDEDNDYNTEAVPGLWEKLRNTVLASGDVWNNSSRYLIEIGFYGPKNGPYADENLKLPYVVICRSLKVTYDPGSVYYGNYYGIFSDLKISRTGDKISYNGGSFNVEFDSKDLTISNADACYVSSYDGKEDAVIDINGRYIMLSSWTEQGSLTSIGFYEIGKGPNYGDHYSYVPDDVQDDRYGYIYFMTSDGSAGRDLDKRKNKDGVYVYLSENDFRFKITVSNDGNTLTISDISMGDNELLYFGRGDSYSGYWKSTEYNQQKFNLFFNGTYTKTSSDPDYSWN